MRIDGPAPSVIARLTGGLPQSGSAQPFEDLLSTPENNAGDAPPKPDQRLFGFDALGVLGMGGRTQGATVREARISAIDSQPLPVTTPGDKPSHALAAAPIVAPSPTPADEASNPVSRITVDPVDASSAPNRTSLTARAAPLSATPGMAEMADTAITEPQGDIDQPAARAVIARYGPSSVFAGMPEPDGPETPFAPRLRLAPDSSPESPSAPVSVAVSEKDGVLHVVAAAPGMAEAARLKLRELAVDIAREGGDVLGGFTLNGASLPEPSSPARSFPWPSRP